MRKRQKVMRVGFALKALVNGEERTVEVDERKHVLEALAKGRYAKSEPRIVGQRVNVEPIADHYWSDRPSYRGGR